MTDKIKKLKLNTVSSLGMQLITIVSGFILPAMIIRTFGSQVNGLVTSIAQFLSAVSFLDLGVGAVVQSSLYKPLADNNLTLISQIYNSANKFFKRLGMILSVYTVILVFVYPLAINGNYGFLYTAGLIIAVFINLFSQYFFGIVNSILLTADQKGYIQYISNIITLVVNTIVCVVLIKLGFSIHVVKFATSIIYLARPLYLLWYVNRNYNIDRNVTYTEEPIKQKWNGMAQHFAAIVLDGTDSIVLTLFSTLENVSVYSVYNMVIVGVKKLFMSVSNGFQSLLGEYIAKDETEKARSFFNYVEWILHTAITVVFGCTGVLLIPFVKVYTGKIDDADYIQPLFSVLITVANAAHTIRLPYNILIKAAGKYKETQRNYVVTMLINVIISVLTVKMYGLVGVSIGTLSSMIYQTVWMAHYNSKNIIYWPMRNFFKQCMVDLLIIIPSSFLTVHLDACNEAYSGWFILAAEVLIIWLAVSVVVNYIFYAENVNMIFNKIRVKFSKNRKE